MAGGPSTPALVAAAGNAGAFGFLAAGYRSADEMAAEITATRRLSKRPFGVNLFVPGAPSAVASYGPYEDALRTESNRVGVDLGTARRDDDDWDAKIALLAADPVAVVSLTFGCPVHTVVTTLQRAGSEVWITATTLEEAIAAVSVGADAVVLQGAEAGGHRGSFDDATVDSLDDGLALSVLLQLVLDIFDVPCVAAGGLATGRSIASVLCAGAVAAQIGTAFLLAPEAGTAPVHRTAIASTTPTAMTRAFTGRLGRGVRNRFTDEYSDQAPSAYPEIHHLTAPLRAWGRLHDDADVVNLWAGQSHVLARELPAAEIIAALRSETIDALRDVQRRLPS
jgi:nitronate monooxygenase